MSQVAPATASMGLSAATLEAICATLARFPHVEKGVLYGSRAKGNFKPGSDIDLTLRGEGLTLSLLGDIDMALDDLLLPFEIDLSIYDQLGHGELVTHIDRVGRVIYQKQPGLPATPRFPVPKPGADPR